MKKTLIAQRRGRLDQILLELTQEDSSLKGLTRSQIKKQIESSLVSINGQKVLKAGIKVEQFDRIELLLNEQRPDQLEHYKIELDLVFEDKDLIVINKPAGLSMHPGAGQRNLTLANALAERFRDAKDFLSLDRAGIVHRLDKDTTGLVVVAKNKAAQSDLAEQFYKRTIERLYIALVLSGPRSRREIDLHDSGRIETRFGRDPKNRLKMAVLEDGARIAITNWQVLRRFKYANLVQLKLETGRTHQIRVHMAHLGSPIIGDKLYGGNKSVLPNDLKLINDQFLRQALHATLLGFLHPRTKEKLVFQAEAPKDFKALLGHFSR